MKSLIICDPHLKVNTIDIFRKVEDKVIELLKTKDIDCLRILGDLFDGHAIIHNSVLNHWIQFINRVNSAISTEFNSDHFKIELYVGNHDKTSPNSYENAVVAFRSMENVKVIDRRMLAANNLDNNVSLPHMKDEDFIEEINQIPIEQRKAAVLFCHQGFMEGFYDNMHKSTAGVSPSVVKDFRYVVSGHYHTEQIFGNIWYPGTAYSWGFDDAGSSKGIYIFDDELLEHDKIEIEGVPKYHILMVDSVEKIGSYFQQFGKQGDFYKVTLKGFEKDIEDYKKTKDYKNLKEAYNLKLVPDYIDNNVKINAVIPEKMSIEDMVDKYVKEILVTDVNKDELAEFIKKEIYG